MELELYTFIIWRDKLKSDKFLKAIPIYQAKRALSPRLASRVQRTGPQFGGAARNRGRENKLLPTLIIPPRCRAAVAKSWRRNIGGAKAKMLGICREVSRVGIGA